MKKDTIFVQIAAYSDPELVPTVKDLFDRAKFPDRIKVAARTGPVPIFFPSRNFSS